MPKAVYLRVGDSVLSPATAAGAALQFFCQSEREREGGMRLVGDDSSIYTFKNVVIGSSALRICSW